MPHLLIAGKLHPAGLAVLQAAEGVTYDYVEDVSEHSYAPMIGKTTSLPAKPVVPEVVMKVQRRSSASTSSSSMRTWRTIWWEMLDSMCAWGPSSRARAPVMVKPSSYSRPRI